MSVLDMEAGENIECTGEMPSFYVIIETSSKRPSRSTKLSVPSVCAPLSAL